MAKVGQVLMRQYGNMHVALVPMLEFFFHTGYIKRWEFYRRTNAKHIILPPTTNHPILPFMLPLPAMPSKKPLLYQSNDCLVSHCFLHPQGTAHPVSISLDGDDCPPVLVTNLGPQDLH